MSARRTGRQPGPSTEFDDSEQQDPSVPQHDMTGSRSTTPDTDHSESVHEMTAYEKHSYIMNVTKAYLDALDIKGSTMHLLGRPVRSASAPPQLSFNETILPALSKRSEEAITYALATTPFEIAPDSPAETSITKPSTSSHGKLRSADASHFSPLRRGDVSTGMSIETEPTCMLLEPWTNCQEPFAEPGQGMVSVSPNQRPEEDEPAFSPEDFPDLGCAQRHDSVIARDTDADTTMVAKTAIIPSIRLDSADAPGDGGAGRRFARTAPSKDMARHARTGLTVPSNTWAKVAQEGKGTAVWEEGIRKAYPK
ncbi:hypothetical protein LTS18_005548 [Coniosporium uncinatum]|uniref:Uncharacterized protein n=1 Tax=Coniosporium uncinatum TaxID=93489 RepID=A0ACC3D4H7_9PEZI|nr:hypothetical protein LTS18_005548 [Coniosporium uncinatum]